MAVLSRMVRGEEGRLSPEAETPVRTLFCRLVRDEGVSGNNGFNYIIKPTGDCKGPWESLTAAWDMGRYEHVSWVPAFEIKMRSVSFGMPNGVSGVLFR